MNVKVVMDKTWSSVKDDQRVFGAVDYASVKLIISLKCFAPIREIDFAVRYGRLGGHPGHSLENTRNKE